MSQSWLARMFSGSAFHAAGPACEKACSPNLVRSRGSDSWVLVEVTWAHALCLLLEKIAEAARKFAALQSDLSRSVAETGDVTDGGILRRRHRQKLPVKGSIDKAVHRSMHDIKLAFSEFYLSLILLQNYQTLNFTGFRKILKKHDKVKSPITSTVVTRASM